MDAVRVETCPARALPRLWPIPLPGRWTPQGIVFVVLFLIIADLVLLPLALVVATALGVGPNARDG